MWLLGTLSLGWFLLTLLESEVLSLPFFSGPTW
jgi:hypothetical protein